MDFLSKNFRYKTQTFQEFVREVDEGKKLYLRALSADKPSDSPANLDTDFPTISKDFLLPSQLQFVKDKLFSSVLRISGPVNMWLHYDVSFPLLPGQKRASYGIKKAYVHKKKKKKWCEPEQGCRFVISNMPLLTWKTTIRF